MGTGSILNKLRELRILNLLFKLTSTMKLLDLLTYSGRFGHVKTKAGGKQVCRIYPLFHWSGE